MEEKNLFFYKKKHITKFKLSENDYIQANINLKNAFNIEFMFLKRPSIDDILKFYSKRVIYFKKNGKNIEDYANYILTYKKYKDISSNPVFYEKIIYNLL